MKQYGHVKKVMLTGMLGAIVLSGAGCTTFQKKEQAPSDNASHQVASVDKVKEEEPEVELKEVPLVVDYTKSATEILAYYTEEGMSRFKLSYPDTYSMEYALKNIGRKMPSFSGKDLNGKTVSSKDFEGKSYIVNVSKSTCEVCTELAPVIQNLEKNADAIPVINMYPIDDSKEVKAYRKKTKWSHDSLVLVGDENKSIKNLAIEELSVETVPTLLFVDKSGRISYINIGLTDDMLLNDMKEKAFGSEKLYDFVKKEVVKVKADEELSKQ